MTHLYQPRNWLVRSACVHRGSELNTGASGASTDAHISLNAHTHVHKRLVTTTILSVTTHFWDPGRVTGNPSTVYTSHVKWQKVNTSFYLITGKAFLLEAIHILPETKSFSEIKTKTRPYKYINANQFHHYNAILYLRHSPPEIRDALVRLRSASPGPRGKTSKQARSSEGQPPTHAVSPLLQYLLFGISLGAWS